MKSKVSELLHSRKNLSSKKKEWEAVGSYKDTPAFWRVLKTAIPVFFVSFWIAFFASSLMTPQQLSDAANSNDSYSAGGYFINIHSSDVNMELLTTATPTMTEVVSNVKTATNAPSGFKLYLGMSAYNASGSEKSAADKLKNGLYLDGNLSRTDGAVINAVGGSAASSLSPLTDSTWGYAVSKTAKTSEEDIPDIWENENHTTMYSAVPNDDKFAAVPAVGSEDLIQQRNTGNVDVTRTPESVQDSEYSSADIYYGVRASASATSGAYSNTIAYSAVAQAAPSPQGEITGFTPAVYTRNKKYEDMTASDWGNVTIQTTLFTNMSDLGTAEVQISGGPQNTSQACTNPTLSIVNNQVAVTCKLPPNYAGKYKVVVNLKKFGQTYTGDYTYAATWNTISAMQEMTKTICDSAGTVTKTTSEVPEVYLKDLRGGGGHLTGSKSTGYTYSATTTGKYRIRKLADGNCWMSENMDLSQSSTSVFNSYDTNLTKVPSTTFSNGSYTQDSDGTLHWTPKNVIDTATCTSGANDCKPDTINTTGKIDTNKFNAHSYNGNGSAGTRTSDTTTCTSTASPNECAIVYNQTETQSIGTYYNWAAATAQSGGNGTGGDDDPAEAPNSFCPYGWRLPSGGDNGTPKSFATLLTGAYQLSNSAYGSTSARSYPVSLVYAGYYSWNTSNLANQTAAGYYESLLANPNNTDHYFLLRLGGNVNYILPQFIDGKAVGFSLRCAF